MRVLVAASEVVGFAKTGGLADVAGALPAALARRGHSCAVILPLYRSACHGNVPLEPTEYRFSVPIGRRNEDGRLWRSALPGSDVPVFLVEHAGFFERDDPSAGRGIYQYTLPSGRQADYSDNAERFLFFSRAVLEAMAVLSFWPDVVHVNDWQTGFVPVFLQEEYRRRKGYQRVRSLLTIHNIAYQGLFPAEAMPLTGLDWRLFNYLQLEFYNHLNFLKAGIVFSDAINTVSPRYAREIQTSEPGCGGCGLEDVLAERSQRLSGIVNGVDYETWNPARDPHLVAPYDIDTVCVKKPYCKAALQRGLGLTEDARAPLLGLVSRLIQQKGIELVTETAERLLNDGCQFAILGVGDPVHHQALASLQSRYPMRFGLVLAQDWTLAHQIEAGADFFLMPSWYEPCGLNQMYSLKYGTLPVVRETGGLADTVVDATPTTLAAGTATGFSFLPYTAAAFHDAVARGLALYRHQPETWHRVVRNAMSQDWSWDRSAAEYERLYDWVGNR